MLRIKNTSDTDNNASVISFTNSAGGGDSAIQGIHEDAAGTNGSRRGHLQFGTSGSDSSGSTVERMRIESAGDVKVTTGDLYFATAGKGIVLGATSNTAANTLDDYEDGTWDSTVSWAGGNTTGTATNTTSVAGTYRKIGNACFVTLSLAPNAYNSGGDCVIVGCTLPFTPTTNSGAACYFYSGNGNYGSWTTGNRTWPVAEFVTSGKVTPYVGTFNGGSYFYGHQSGQTAAQCKLSLIHI